MATTRFRLQKRLSFSKVVAPLCGGALPVKNRGAKGWRLFWPGVAGSALLQAPYDPTRRLCTFEVPPSLPLPVGAYLQVAVGHVTEFLVAQTVVTAVDVGDCLKIRFGTLGFYASERSDVGVPSCGRKKPANVHPIASFRTRSDWHYTAYAVVS